jgi:hypothetical protein
MRTVLVYLASVLALWFALRWATDLGQYEQLNASAVHTSGTVTSTTCANHASFTYEYLVQGQHFAASGKSSEGGLSCAQLSAGQVIPVAYLANSPAVSIAGNVGAALFESRSFVVAASLTFPAVALWLRRRAQKREDVA